MYRALFRILSIMSALVAISRGPGAMSRRYVRRRAFRGMRRLGL